MNPNDVMPGENGQPEEYEVRPACPECGEHRLQVEVELVSSIDVNNGEGFVGIWNYRGKRIPMLDTDRVTEAMWQSGPDLAIACPDCGWREDVPDYEYAKQGEAESHG